MNPFFSIIIPAYNVAGVIQDTLNSVYCQTWEDFEIIVVDDGSSDLTPSILRAQTDKRLRIISQKNRGVSSARNLGIKEAKGEFIAFLDADDLWAADHLLLAHSFFENHPGINWYTAQWKACPIEQKQISSIQQGHPNYTIYNYYISGSFHICSSAVILRKASIDNTKWLFPERLTWAEDTTAWLQFAAHNPLLGHYNGVTVAYRMRSDSETHTRKTPQERILDHQKALYEAMSNAFGNEQHISVASFFRKKELFFYSWHYVITNNTLRGYLATVWKYRKEEGPISTLYVMLYIILNNVLSQSFAWPMRMHRRIYFKILSLINK